MIATVLIKRLPGASVMTSNAVRVAVDSEHAFVARAGHTNMLAL